MDSKINDEDCWHLKQNIRSLIDNQVKNKLKHIAHSQGNFQNITKQLSSHQPSKNVAKQPNLQNAAENVSNQPDLHHSAPNIPKLLSLDQVALNVPKHNNLFPPFRNTPQETRQYEWTTQRSSPSYLWPKSLHRSLAPSTSTYNANGSYYNIPPLTGEEFSCVPSYERKVNIVQRRIIAGNTQLRPAQELYSRGTPESRNSSHLDVEIPCGFVKEKLKEIETFNRFENIDNLTTKTRKTKEYDDDKNTVIVKADKEIKVDEAMEFFIQSLMEKIEDLEKERCELNTQIDTCIVEVSQQINEKTNQNSSEHFQKLIIAFKALTETESRDKEELVQLYKNKYRKEKTYSKTLEKEIKAILPDDVKFPIKGNWLN